MRTKEVKKTTHLFANLRREMGIKGYTIKSLARELGVSEGTLRNKLNGTVGFYLDEVNTISKIFQKTQEELFKKEIQ